MTDSALKWSKATYTYGVAACLLQIGGEAERKEANKYIRKVEGLRQRIAGKSIPLEVKCLFSPPGLPVDLGG